MCILVTHVLHMGGYSVEVYSVNVGDNEHQDSATHTNMSRRLIVHDNNSHYEPSLAHGGAVLVQEQRFCAYFLVPNEALFTCALHRKRGWKRPRWSVCPSRMLRIVDMVHEPSL